MLVPRPGIEPSKSALEVQSLNHWTTREVHQSAPFLKKIPLYYLSSNLIHVQSHQASVSPLGRFCHHFTHLCFDSDFLTDILKKWLY